MSGEGLSCRLRESCGQFTQPNTGCKHHLLPTAVDTPSAVATFLHSIRTTHIGVRVERRGDVASKSFFLALSMSWSVVYALSFILALGPNSIEKIWLEFWLEKSLHFWLQISHNKKMFKSG